ncbi:conserved unknown protein [Ectocarpus siliculosus]|uniref:BZIP domain-containing protein n=1 Tax=Ectocarpus siliculosus TaxID=2880 RepID=D7FR79_ECTSI|nr:conserved unknown protein [Ectocarpus siliculosus]|eukprot:CBJ49204.1 conserved unknown protein [Ectocarpus siliculosus]
MDVDGEDEEDLFDAILQPPDQDDQDLLSFFLSPDGLETTTTTASDTTNDIICSPPPADGGGGGGGMTTRSRNSSGGGGVGGGGVRNTSNSGSIPSLSENFGNAAAAAAAAAAVAVERGGGGAHAGMPKKLLGPRPRGIGNASGVEAMEGVEDKPSRFESTIGGGAASGGDGGGGWIGGVMPRHGRASSLSGVPGGGVEGLPRSPGAAGLAASGAAAGFSATHPPAGVTPMGRRLSPPHGGTTLGDERRQKRLARNRESARQSRRRKKEHLELLEEKSLGELERHLAAMDASVAASSSGGGDGASSGAPLPSSSPLPADMEDALANGLRHMSGRVGANCGERRAVVSHQLRLLEGLAAPPHTRVLMWLAVQDESFFRARQQQQQPPNLASARPPNIATDIISPGSGGSGGGGDVRSAATTLPTNQTNQEESPDNGGGGSGGVSPSSATSNTVVASSSWSAGEEGGGGGGGGSSSGSNSSNSNLWRLLCQELGLTDSQEGQFLQFQRAVAASPPTLAERDRLRRLSRVLAGLRASTEACMADVHARAATLMEILTPSQTVRYLGWVARTAGDPADCPTTLPSLTSLLAGAADTCASTDTPSTAATAARPVPRSPPATLRSGGGKGIDNSGERGEVLRLWRKRNENLTLEEMEWLVLWVRRTQSTRRQRQQQSRRR